MNLLYVCYWSINDGLTHSTVFPALLALHERSYIKNIVLVTIERETKEVQYSGPNGYKIAYKPLYSKNIRPALLNKISDFIYFPKQIEQICKDYCINVIVARGAPAGSLVLSVAAKRHIPFIVESFEPHAEYMRVSGVWHSLSPKFLFESIWEKQQKQKATAIITVSEKYRETLIHKEQLPEKRVWTIPCIADVDKFVYSSTDRERIRTAYNISCGTRVGIYVGKFGGIYYSQKAYECFAAAYRFWKEKFFLIILTPQSVQEIETQLINYKIPLNKVLIKRVPHAEVPGYLSAADFAYSFHRSSKVSHAFSPIKNGEYWANGLPIVISDNIGDDSDIVKKHHAGLVFNASQPLSEGFFEHLEVLLSQNTRESMSKIIKPIALRYRDKAILNRVYDSIFKTLKN